MDKISEIVQFISKHPQTTASRRICREILGQSRDRVDLEFANELTLGLQQTDIGQVDLYYCLIR